LTNSIIQIDATPYKQWFERYYGSSLGKKKTSAKETPTTTKESATTKEAPKGKSKKLAKEKEKELKEAKVAADAAAAAEQVKKSRSVITKLHKRARNHKLEHSIEDQFITGRLYACISSRPGQSGRCDGYILEGKELEFYLKKIHQKKKGAKQ